MIEIFDFSHKKRVKTIDSFKFEVIIVILLNGSSEVITDQSVQIFKFPKKLEDTFMTDFSDSDLDTSEIENHLTQ